MRGYHFWNSPLKNGTRGTRHPAALLRTRRSPLRQLQLLPPPISRNELTLARGHREGETRPWLIGTARVDFSMATSAAGVSSRRVQSSAPLPATRDVGWPAPRRQRKLPARPGKAPRHGASPALVPKHREGQGSQAPAPAGSGQRRNQ